MLKTALPTLWIVAVFAGGAVMGCDTASKPPPAPALAVPALPGSTGPGPTPPDAMSPHVYRYELVLTFGGGVAPKTRMLFSVGVSEASPGSASFAKNVGVRGSDRADVGARVKAKITMEGSTPKLDLETEIYAVDLNGKALRLSPHGAAVTPLGTATVVLDTEEMGEEVRVTATPSIVAIDAGKPRSAPPWQLDVVVAEGPETSPTKAVPLLLTLVNDAPVVASKSDNVPLIAGGAPRQSVGTRVKASARPHGAGLELDFDFELSAIENGTTGASIRKIRTHGPLLAPLDTPVVAFVGEEDGARYEVKLKAKTAPAQP